MAYSLNEWHWVAGFLEGEGSFVAHTRSSPKHKTTEIRIQASQVQREPLDRLQRYIGGKIYGPLTNGKLARVPIFLWSITGHKAATLMLQLRPFMSPRRQMQIDRAYARWSSRRTQSDAQRIRSRARWDRESHDSRQLRLIGGT